MIIIEKIYKTLEENINKIKFEYKYSKDLTFKYLGDREDYNDRQIPVRARLTLNTMYSFTSNDNVTLTINNLLDRDNYSNRYGNLDLPLNWKVMYEHTF